MLSSNIVLKWFKIIIKLTFLILILSTPPVAAHFINRTPIYLPHFLAYLFNLFILLVSLVIRDILVNGLPIFCDKVIRGILILLVIVIPIFFWLPLYDTFDLAKLTIMYTLNLIILAMWLIKTIASKEVKLCRTPLDIPILVLLGINLLATITSISPTISFFGFYKRYEGLLPMANYIFLYYVVVNFMNTPKLVTRLIKPMLMTASIIAIYGICQHFEHDPFKWSFSAKERVFATFGNPVFLSAYLIMMLPLGLAMFLLKELQPLHHLARKKEKGKKKLKKNISYYELFLTWKDRWVTFFNFIAPWLYIISVILIFICFIYTRGRATTIGLEVGMIVFYLIICGIAFSFTFYGALTLSTILGFIIIFKCLSPTHILIYILGGIFMGLSFFGPLIFNRGHIPFSPRKWDVSPINVSPIKILALVLIGITIGFNIDPKTSVITRIINTVIKVESTTAPVVEKKKELNLEDRIQQALPPPKIEFTGGTQEERASLWKSTIGIIFKDTRNFILGIGLDTLQLMNIGTDKAHNDFLDITVTRGIIGLIAYLWLIIAYIWVSFRSSFQEVDRNKKLLIAAFLACELGYLIQNQFSFGLVTILSYFWIVMGMTMVVIKPQTKYSKQSTIIPRLKNLSVRVSLYTLIMGIIIVLIYLAFRPFIADSYYRRGFDFVEKHKYEEAVPGLEKAVKIFPYENCYWKVLNSIYVERANNDPEERKMWAKKAIEGSKFLLTLIPKDAGSYFNMGMAYYLDGDATKSISSYKKVLELEPKHMDAMNNLATTYANQGNYKEAEELFKKVFKLNPNHASAKNNLIQLYKIQGKFEESTKLDENYAKQTYLQSTKNYYEKGEIDKAIIEIKKVLALDDRDIQSHRNLGSFYLLKKRYKEAQAEFNKVLELNPNDSYAQQMLENINSALLSNSK